MASSRSPAVPTNSMPAAAVTIAAVPSRTTGWSSTMATRMRAAGAVTGDATRARRASPRWATRDVEKERADLLRALLHVRHPEMAAGERGLGRPGVDPRSGVVDGERDTAGLVHVVADGDRCPAVLDRVRQRLLRDAEDGNILTTSHGRSRPANCVQSRFAPGIRIRRRSD